MTKNREIVLTRLGLTENESKIFLEKMVTHTLPKEAIVLEKGSSSDALFIVLEGRAKAVEIDANGDEQVLSYYEPGEHFGWVGFGDGVLTSSIMTAESSRFLAIPNDEIKSLLVGNHSFRESVQERDGGETERNSLEPSEAEQQKTAISEILRAISSSPSDLQLILETVAENAARLCDVNDAEIFKVEGDALRLVAKYGKNPLWPIGTLHRI